MRRIALGSCIGTTVEWYDFFIYGTATALVFSKVFFPTLGAAAGTLAAFATFSVAFFARPFGAVLFGHFGDRLGRKRTLVATLLMMGLSTGAIGLIPSATAIGALAPILLVLLRVAQGIAVGGEWAGATLLVNEHAPTHSRGKYAVYPQVAPGIAFLLASATFLIIELATTDEFFMAYGWRFPFVGSFVLVLIGLYIRLRITETPAFKAIADQSTAVRRRAPLAELLQKQPRELLLTGGLLAVTFALFYVATAYLTSYGTSAQGAGLSRQTVLVMGMGAALVLIAATVASGRLSDKYGRRTVIMVSFGLTVPVTLILYSLLATQSALVLGLAIAASLGLYGLAYGAVGAYLPELFATEYRYTGAGMGYNLGGILGGGLIPFAATDLGSRFGPYAVGILVAAVALISLWCTYVLRETHVRSPDKPVITTDGSDAPVAREARNV